jgi:hypothetical protein
MKVEDDKISQYCFWAQFEEGKDNPPRFFKSFVDIKQRDFIALDEIKRRETKENSEKIVHCFVYDDRMERYYSRPNDYIKTLSQYHAVCGTDFSTFLRMNPVEQNMNILRNRRLCAFWQQSGLLVIPTITWAEDDTFDMAFNNFEPGCTVIVSTLNYFDNKDAYLHGFSEMVKRVQPATIICYAGVKEDFFDFFDRRNLIGVKFRNDRSEREELHLTESGQISLFPEIPVSA